MATAPRRTTGKAAPVKGAASAVSAPSAEMTNIEADPAITVNPDREHDPDREALRAAAAMDNVTTTPDVTPKVTEGVHGEVGAVEQPSMADLEALRRLADTSGLIDPATPYPADDFPAPNPLDLLGPPRREHKWYRETDTDLLTARVIVDGYRAFIDGNYWFAQRNERITAPADIIRNGERKGALVIEEE